jgi:hypothetical protein
MRGDLAGGPNRIPHALVEVRDTPVAKGGWAVELRPHNAHPVLCNTGKDMADAYRLAEEYIANNFVGKTL